MAYFTDMLFRAQTPPAQGDAGDARAEVGRILARSAINGDLSADDKAYVYRSSRAKPASATQDAEKRVNDVLAEAKATADDVAAKAKQAAETARKVGIYTSLWVFVSLLVGAFSATCMATVGGRLRDDLPANSKAWSLALSLSRESAKCRRAIGCRTRTSFSKVSADWTTESTVEPFATVGTLGEALATLELRAADPNRMTDRFLVQRDDEPPMTLEEIRDKLISEDKVGYRL